MDLVSINLMIMTITKGVQWVLLESILWNVLFSQMFSLLIKVTFFNAFSEEEHTRRTFRAQMEGIILPFTREPILDSWQKK